MKVGIFGSEYQIERQNLIKRLFEKLREHCSPSGDYF